MRYELGGFLPPETVATGFVTMGRRLLDREPHSKPEQEVAIRADRSLWAAAPMTDDWL